MNIVINGIDLTEPKKILLISSDDLLMEDVIEIKRALFTEFPDTKFVILNGFSAHIVKDEAATYDIEVEDE